MIDLSWLPDDGGTGHMPPSEEVISFWKHVKQYTNFKHLTEIGFNAGHSSSIILSLFDDVKVSSYDVGMYDITISNGEIVKNKFPNRFDLTIKDSKELNPSDISNSNILFIDGSHDYPEVRSDIDLFLKSDLRYAIIDDLQNKNVQRAYNESISHYKLLVENKYKAVLPFHMRGTRPAVNVPVRLVEKK